MAEISLTIEGMSCNHCVMSVKKAVESIEGVQSSDITVGSARIVYDDSKTGRDAIALVIGNAGYKVKD
jgi:copper chaperone